MMFCLFLTFITAVWSAERKVCDVSSYGAKADGVTDDTAAIQKAIDDVSASGGVVQLGAGKYRITNTLLINADYVVFKGMGRQVTTIWADGEKFNALQVGTDARKAVDVSLSDFCIDRPKQADEGVCNIFIAMSNPISLENLTIGRAGDGIFIGSRTAPDICGCVSIQKVWMGLCRRCLVIATAADVLISHMYGGYTDVGVYLTGGSNNIRLTDSLFLTCRPNQGKHGLVSDGVGFMQEVKGCVFEETSEEVIKVTGIMRFFFHDNWLNANPEFPMIRMEKVDVFSLRSTRFGGSGTSCVELDHCSRGDVTGNNMESSRGIGIIVKGGGSLEIQSNQMTGNDKEGIRIQDDAQSVRLYGNHVNGGVNAIHLMPNAGDKFIIDDNFLSHGKGGKYILNESKAKTKIIKNNINE